MCKVNPNKCPGAKTHESPLKPSANPSSMPHPISPACCPVYYRAGFPPPRPASASPSSSPSDQPSMLTSVLLSTVPSSKASTIPSSLPSDQPSMFLSDLPSMTSSFKPSASPSSWEFDIIVSILNLCSQSPTFNYFSIYCCVVQNTISQSCRPVFN